jgi:hypothetical protein
VVGAGVVAGGVTGRSTFVFSVTEGPELPVGQSRKPPRTISAARPSIMAMFDPVALLVSRMPVRVTRSGSFGWVLGVLLIVATSTRSCGRCSGYAP